MNHRTLAKIKHRNSTTVLPIFGKKPAGVSFYNGAANEGRTVSNSGLGHNFGDVKVVSPSFKQTCPLALSSPTYCPFGGACHTCPPRVQAKLRIGRPGDKYEQEADRVAEQVMRMPEPKVQSKGCLSCNDMDEEEKIQPKPVFGRITPLLQRQEAELEEEDEEEILQTKEVVGQTPGVTRNVQMNIKNLRGTGKPLPEFERSFFEQRFGYDFSQVRIHTGAYAEKAARSVNARAFTVGSDVIFGMGQYAPKAVEGKHLLAHELTHVVQQRASSVSSTSRLSRLIANVVLGDVIQRQEKTPYKAKILSLEEIKDDDKRETLRKRSGQTKAKLCRSISKSLTQENCPTSLSANTDVIVISEKVGGLWLQIDCQGMPGLGSKEQCHVLGVFVKPTHPKKVEESKPQLQPPETQKEEPKKLEPAPQAPPVSAGLLPFSSTSLIGNAWLQLPRSWKVWLVDKAIEANLMIVDKFPGKAVLGDLWIFMKEGLIGFYEKLKSAKENTKILVTDKIARIMAGQSLGYTLGLLKGLLKGFFVDGLLGIFIAIWDLIKGLKHLWTFFEKVGKLIGGFPDKIARLIQDFKDLGQDILNNIEPAIEEFKKFISDPSQAQTLVTIIIEKGKSYSKQAGQKIAESLLKFFSKPGSEAQIGEIAGRGIGMVLFEVIFAILTSGAGAAVTGVKTAARFLAKIGGKILGSVLKVFREIHRLFGIVVDVVKQGAKFVKGKVLGKVTGKFGKLLEKVKEFIKRILTNCHESKIVCNFAKAILKAHEVSWKGFTIGQELIHFGKHGAEFGAKSANAYLKLAKEFAKKTGTGIREHKVVNTIFKYEEATNTLFIGNAKGRHIKTFYKPNNGLAGYFEAIRKHIEVMRKLGK